MKVQHAIICLLVIAAVAQFRHRVPPQEQVVVILPNGDVPAVVVSSLSYRYDAPPSIDRSAYIAIMCEAGPSCDEAGSMYDLLVSTGIDPVIEAAQADHETGRGTTGVGRPAYKNLHGVQCHAGDGRIADSKVAWGNNCAGVYATYLDSVRTWTKVIINEYVALGLNTPALAVNKYAPTSDGNDTPEYIAAMEAKVDQWRIQYPLGMPAPAQYANSYTAPALQVQGQGCLETNVTSAWTHSPGLQAITIVPGDSWSFNANWVVTDDQVSCAGQGFVGGGVCNQASRYSNVARNLGLEVHTTYHGYVYDSAVPAEDNITIYTADAAQDLIIHNTTARTVIMSAVLQGGQLIVSGGFR